MNCHDGILRTLRILAIALTITSAVFLGLVQAAFADSPVVVVSRWKFDRASNRDCNKFSLGAYDLDTFTRDSLAYEWDASFHPESLKAGAVLIRSVARYFRDHPEWTDSQAGNFCNNVSPYYFNLRSSKIQGFRPGGGSMPRSTCDGIAPPCNVPDDRVTDTGGKVALRNGSLLEYKFNADDQNQTNTLGNNGLNYVQILQDPSIYNHLICVFGPGDERPCGIALSVNTDYVFTRSMTNGTAPFYRQGDGPSFSDQLPPLCGAGAYSCYGVHTGEVTAEGISRQAERYWGFYNLISASYDGDHNFTNPGIYVTGPSRGSKAEYLMSFGGSHQNTIRISGIDDNPGPVRVNIYVDGIYQFQIAWSANDNSRRQINRVLGASNQFAAGTHAVAIEFAQDRFLRYDPNDPNSPCPSANNPDCDRNMYLDNFLVTNP